ncbi:hypothetical protein T484DRAFT_1806481, partial [Baffinella frigidus]
KAVSLQGRGGAVEGSVSVLLQQVQDGEEEVRKARAEAREAARNVARLENQNSGWQAARDVLLEDMEREKEKFRLEMREETRAIEQDTEREKEKFWLEMREETRAIEQELADARSELALRSTLDRAAASRTHPRDTSYQRDTPHLDEARSSDPPRSQPPETAQHEEARGSDVPWREGGGEALRAILDRAAAARREGAHGPSLSPVAPTLQQGGGLSLVTRQSGHATSDSEAGLSKV